jgi:hypothetical protein
MASRVKVPSLKQQVELRLGDTYLSGILSLLRREDRDRP